MRERLAFLRGSRKCEAGLAGTICRETYIDYLTQAYHHVRHTVPLMIEARERLAHRPELVAALDEYIAEETGHEEWILKDIAAAGGDARPPAAAGRARQRRRWSITPMPASGTGTRWRFSVWSTCSRASAWRSPRAVPGPWPNAWDYPPEALTYLNSHGALDQSHMRFLEGLVNTFEDNSDRTAVIGMAREIFGLFGAMFASIDMEPVDVAA